jgi:hypothetical protein
MPRMVAACAAASTRSGESSLWFCLTAYFAAGERASWAAAAANSSGVSFAICWSLDCHPAVTLSVGRAMAAAVGARAQIAISAATITRRR